MVIEENQLYIGRLSQILNIMSFNSFLVNQSISKTKEELKDINVANLWVLFLICLPIGLILVYFWF